MKRIISLLICSLFLVGCTGVSQPSERQYTATFLNYFDTVTTVVGRAESEEAFREKIKPICDGLEHYHRLFDIYNEYDGIVNLKTVNSTAAEEPIKVDGAIIELLLDAKKYSAETSGSFNHAMGTVLSLWHDAREDGINDPEHACLPDSEELKKAAEHTDPDSVVIDSENSTVFFTDPDVRLDVGAIAKGWATERVCRSAPEGLLVSVGGNVCATGAKDGSGTPWVIGVQNPDGSEDHLHTLNITKGSVVTSGSYQRAYAVEGKLYHHIIDPETLYPSEKWVSVTVVSSDSGLADVLSTSLFVLSQDDGQALLDKFGASAMWVDQNGNKFYSPDFRELIRS